MILFTTDVLYRFPCAFDTMSEEERAEMDSVPNGWETAYHGTHLCSEVARGGHTSIVEGTLVTYD